MIRLQLYRLLARRSKRWAWPHWALASIYLRRMWNGVGPQQQSAELAIPPLERALSLWRTEVVGGPQNVRAGFALQGLSEANLLVGKLDEAAHFALELVRWSDSLDPDYPNPDFHRYHGYTLLGLAALRRGDITGAAENLAASIHDTTSAGIGRRPLPMSLATELLQVGETEGVKAFLEDYIRLKPDEATRVRNLLAQAEQR